MSVSPVWDGMFDGFVFGVELAGYGWTVAVADSAWS